MSGDVSLFADIFWSVFIYVLHEFCFCISLCIGFSFVKSILLNMYFLNYLYCYYYNKSNVQDTSNCQISTEITLYNFSFTF